MPVAYDTALDEYDIASFHSNAKVIEYLKILTERVLIEVPLYASTCLFAPSCHLPGARVQQTTSGFLGYVAMLQLYLSLGFNF